MKLIKILILLSFFLSLSTRLHADPSPEKTFRHPDSSCIVKATSGEYPLYKVWRSGVLIYEPKSDGIVKVVFSPNGEYIAFSGSEISGVDINPGVYEYSVVILECKSGTLKGFTAGFPQGDLEWHGNHSLSFTDSATGNVVKLSVPSFEYK